MKTQLCSSRDLSAIVVPAPGVLVQEMDGESVLLHSDGERYFCLDGVATRIWQHLLGHRQLARICQEMQKEYDVDESRLRTDVLQLVDELLAAGIVTIECDVNDGVSETGYG